MKARLNLFVIVCLVCTSIVGATHVSEATESAANGASTNGVPFGELKLVPHRYNVVAPDIRNFLITAGSKSSNSLSLKIEPWLAAGITNLDRSAEFQARLHEATANSNLVAQAYSGLLLLTGGGGAPNRIKGYAMLESVAKQGFLPAMNEIGYINLFGKYEVARNAAEGIKWLRDAAEQGFADAQFHLALCYEQGHGVDVDLDEVHKWSELATAQNHPLGVGGLGLCYMEGKGVMVDYEAAETFLLTSIALGNTRAKLNLGILYTDKGFKTNEFKRGIDLIREAAEAGDFRAQVAYGDLNFRGKGMPTNANNFLQWNRRAAEAGFADAQVNIGRFFLMSDASSLYELSEARRWLLLASQQDHAEACYLLGHLYETGKGVATNLVEAARFNGRAAKQGHLDAQFSFGGALLLGRGVETNVTEGLAWIRRSAENGWPRAEFILGVYHVQGSYGVVADNKTAMEWITKAAEHGNIDAQFEMASTYLYGKYDAPKDIQTAVRWFQKAADQGHAASQCSVGYARETGVSGPLDWIEAYKWYELAVRQKDPTAKINMERLRPKLKADQIEEGVKRANEFVPKRQLFEPFSKKTARK